jgi:transcriptional regulator with XRE-family HTH domain
MNQNELIDRIIETRVRQGYTQRSLAAAAGVPTNYIQRLETKVHSPNLNKLLKVLAVLRLELTIHETTSNSNRTLPVCQISNMVEKQQGHL